MIRKEFERSVRERMEKDWTEKETSLRAQFTKERDQVMDQNEMKLSHYIYRRLTE